MKSIIDALKEQYTKYPLRQCRSLLRCSVCEERINDGEEYYDGGYDNRAHEECVNPKIL